MEIRDSCEDVLARTQDSEAAGMLAIKEINDGGFASYGDYLLDLMTRAQQAIDDLRQPTDAPSA